MEYVFIGKTPINEIEKADPKARINEGKPMTGLWFSAARTDKYVSDWHELQSSLGEKYINDDSSTNVAKATFNPDTKFVNFAEINLRLQKTLKDSTNTILRFDNGTDLNAFKNAAEELGTNDLWEYIISNFGGIEFTNNVMGYRQSENEFISSLIACVDVASLAVFNNNVCSLENSYQWLDFESNTMKALSSKIFEDIEMRRKFKPKNNGKNLIKEELRRQLGVEELSPRDEMRINRTYDVDRSLEVCVLLAKYGLISNEGRGIDEAISLKQEGNLAKFEEYKETLLQQLDSYIDDDESLAKFSKAKNEIVSLLDGDITKLTYSKEPVMKFDNLIMEKALGNMLEKLPETEDRLWERATETIAIAEYLMENENINLFYDGNIKYFDSKTNELHLDGENKKVALNIDEINAKLSTGPTV